MYPASRLSITFLVRDAILVSDSCWYADALGQVCLTLCPSSGGG